MMTVYCHGVNLTRDVIDYHRPSFQCPDPKSPCLCLADAKCGGNFPDRQAILKKRSRPLQDRGAQIVIPPANAILFIRRKCIEFRLKWHRSITTNPIPEFFKMDFKSRTMPRGIILGTAQGDNRIESVLSSGRATLGSSVNPARESQGLFCARRATALRARNTCQ
jgi:hypothetical protein